MSINSEPHDSFQGTERVMMLAVAAVPLMVMVPLSIAILLTFSTYHRALSDGLPMFKTICVFIVITVLFYLNHCARGINLSFGDFSHDTLFVLSTVPLYGGHFLFFVVLLFNQLVQIFNHSQYAISQCAKNVYRCALGVGLADAVLFVAVLLIQPEGERRDTLRLVLYLVGTAAIILTYLWISCLYIVKMFKVMKDTTKSALGRGRELSTSRSRHGSIASSIGTTTKAARELSRSAKGNEQILSSITKYTLLTAVSLLVNMTFWATPFLFGNNFFAYQVTYLFSMQLSISVNLASFALGFRFAHKVYDRLCTSVDSSCKLCFQCLVYCTVPKMREAKKRDSTHKRVKSAPSLRNMELEIREHTTEVVATKAPLPTIIVTP